MSKGLSFGDIMTKLEIASAFLTSIQPQHPENHFASDTILGAKEPLVSIQASSRLIRDINLCSNENKVLIMLNVIGPGICVRQQHMGGRQKLSCSTGQPESGLGPLSAGDSAPRPRLCWQKGADHSGNSFSRTALACISASGLCNSINSHKVSPLSSETNGT